MRFTVKGERHVLGTEGGPAHGGAAGVAGRAGAALAEGRQYDVVADVHTGDGRPDLGDDAGPLVTHDQWGREGDGAVDDAHIAVAHTGVDDSHHHLTWAGLAHLQAIDEAQFVAVEDDAPHASPLTRCPRWCPPDGGATILAGGRGDSPPVDGRPPAQPWMIKETATKWAATARTTRVCHTSW